MGHRSVSRFLPSPAGVVVANDFRSVWTSILLDGFRSRVFVVHGKWQLSSLRAKILRLFGIRTYCVNRALVELALSLGIRRVKVLPLGPGDAPPEEIRSEICESSSPRHLVFGTVARLDKIKRLELFVQVVNELGSQGIIVCPPARNPEQQALLSNLCDREGITVHSDGNASKMWYAANIFLSTSLDESLGLAHLEALQRGIPVLTTAHQGPTDFMKGILSIGLLPQAPSQITSAVQEALDQIMSHREEYYASAINVTIGRGPEACATAILEQL